MSRDTVWAKIFERYAMDKHNFDEAPFALAGKQIKAVSRHFDTTSDREVRVLCKQDTRESRPGVFKEKGLFLLPVTNSSYVVVKGEGYIDIPPVTHATELYVSKLDYKLDTSTVGNSEMQHIDFAYASSLIRTALADDSLVLTIRGRKYTPTFTFRVNQSEIQVSSVQTEVDAGYEGRNQVALVEAKATHASNTLIRQLYYPFRQWQQATKKKIISLFFAKNGNEYSIWHFEFADPNNYNSIYLVDSRKFIIKSLNV